MANNVAVSNSQNGMRIQLNWSTKPGELANETAVTIKVGMHTTDGSTRNASLELFELDWETEVTFSETVYFEQVKPTNAVITEANAVVTHNLYGEGSLPVSVKANVDGAIVTFQYTIQLEPIIYENASSIYVSSYTAKMGEKLLLSITRSDSSFYHELRYELGGESRTIAYDIANSYTWDIPDLASLCENATSGTCKILCLTYQDYVYCGCSEVEIVLEVPDASIPSAAEQFILGTGYTITCPLNSYSFTNRVEFEFGEKTWQIGENAESSFYWHVPYDLANQIPTQISANGTLKCTTLNGTAVVGVNDITVKVTVPDNDSTKPFMRSDGLELAPFSNLSNDFSGLYIRGKTGLKATMHAVSTYSPIAEYTVTVGSVSSKGNPCTVELLVDEGDITVTAKVTDSRGFSRIVTSTIYVYPYRRPKVIPYSGYSDIVCERAKSSGELSPSGTYLAIKAGKNFSAVSPSGTNLNPCALRYRWKASNATDFGSWNTILANGSADTEKSLLIGGIVSSLSTSYEVEIQASDALGGEHTLTFAIMTEAISFVLYDGVDGAGFGKYPEEPHVVDIASHMTLRVRGSLVVDSAGWKSLGMASGIQESAYAVGRHEESGCHYYIDNGNHVYLAFNCAFTYSGTSLVINGSMIPAEYRPARTMYMLCPANERFIALISVRTTGYIYVEWVQNMAAGVSTGSAYATWIDGYLDYWI